MTAQRQNYASGAKWEPVVGYSRAVRVGPFVHVAGTTAVDAHGAIVGIGDPYAQTKRILEIIEAALRSVGASLGDVVHTRMFVTKIEQWEEVGRAHGDVFGHIRPVATMVEVSRLVSPEMLVEIEAEAIIADALPD